jgi:hypothetical protein
MDLGHRRRIEAFTAEVRLTPKHVAACTPCRAHIDPH